MNQSVEGSVKFAWLIKDEKFDVVLESVSASINEVLVPY